MMTEQPLVSIVLPTYNGARFIRESIESILNQTYSNWELIIVNDCSTDNTLDIADEYAQKDSRIRVISNASNKKLPASLNVGFSNSNGKYYTWTSDDNIFRENAINYMVNFLENNDYDCIACDYDLIDEDGAFVRVHSEYCPHNLTNLTKTATVGACFMYTRNIAEQVGEYEEAMFCAEDYDYWCRLALVGQIYFSDENLYQYRINSQSLSATKQNIVFDRVEDIRLKFSTQIMDKYKFPKKLKRRILLELYMWRRDKRWLSVVLKYDPLYILNLILYANNIKLYEELSFVFYILFNRRKKVVLWGASIFLKHLIEKYRINAKNIIGIIDKNKDLWGTKLHNYTIYPPEKLGELKPDKVIFTVKNSNDRIYPKIKDYLQKNHPEIQLVENLFKIT